MTREEMIEVLIQDRKCEVQAGIYDTLENIFVYGWKGYDNWTDRELEEEFENLNEEKFDEKTAAKIIKEKKRIELKRVKKFKLKAVLDELIEDMDQEPWKKARITAKRGEEKEARLPF